MIKIRQFGDPVLRQKSALLTSADISTEKTRQLLKEMKLLLSKDNYGVAVSACQLGEPIAIVYISIKPTPTRPNLEKLSMTVFNPRVVKHYGNKKQMWEGCYSLPKVFAKVPRYKKIRVSYQTSDTKFHEVDVDGFLAHVLQHEIDHLDGILFVDRVCDSKTIITLKEYKKLIKAGLA